MSHCPHPQVSWSTEHKLTRSGTYEVKFFDEESYSVLRKVSKAQMLWFSGTVGTEGGAGSQGAWVPSCYVEGAGVVPQPSHYHSPPWQLGSGAGGVGRGLGVRPNGLFLPTQAQRNNEDVSKIQPLFTVNVEHRVRVGSLGVGRTTREGQGLRVLLNHWGPAVSPGVRSGLA